MSSAQAFDPVANRKEFPLIAGRADGDQIVYLDNAATTQKPESVLAALSHYYSNFNANVHRGVHTLSDEATLAFEDARQTVAGFVNAESVQEIIWTRGTTESLNLVAACCGFMQLGENDVILVTEMEHHSNIVPWQMLAERTGASLKAVPVLDDGTLDFDQFRQSLDERVKIAAFSHVSNALGSINPIHDMIEQIHAIGAIAVIDGAQAAAHIALDVQALDCDFYAFSGHKMYGPTGIGVLYGKASLLNAMPPWQGGGEMIESVTLEKTTYQGLPYKFEAGTPNIAGAIGLQAAVRYIESLDRAGMSAHETDLLAYATSNLNQIDGLKIVGTSPHKGPIVSFLLQNGHPHDVGTLLNSQNVAVRTGHHCAMPLMESLGIPGTVRASFALYNSREDVDRLVSAVVKANQLMS